MSGGSENNKKRKRYVSLSNKLTANNMAFEIGNCEQHNHNDQQINCEKKWMSPPKRKQVRLSTLHITPLPQFLPTHICHSSPTKYLFSNFPIRPNVVDSPHPHFSLSENSQCHRDRQQQVKPKLNLNLNLNLKGKLSFHSILTAPDDIPGIPLCRDVRASSINSFQMVSEKSANTQNSTGPEISQFEKIPNPEEYNRKFSSTEKNNVGGALNLLVDAIELMENEQHHKAVGLHAQKKALLRVEDTIDRAKNVVPKSVLQERKPSLQNHQSRVDPDDMEARKNQALDEIRLQRECDYNPKTNSEGGYMHHPPKPLTRSKRGRLQALPSKYSDSILQPWKKVARKVPTCASS
eukprot:Gb_16942 [translate_table: standard]